MTYLLEVQQRERKESWRKNYQYDHLFQRDMILQFIAEMLVVRNYAIAVISIVPQCSIERYPGVRDIFRHPSNQFWHIKIFIIDSIAF